TCVISLSASTDRRALRRCRMEGQRRAVYAVAQAGRRRAVVEDMAEMTAAAAAMHFGADHAEGRIPAFPHSLGNLAPEARPSGAGLELGLGRIDRQVAAR